MSLKDAYTPLNFAPLDLGREGGSKKELVLFHIPDGLDPEQLQDLVINLEASSSRPTTFTPPSSSSSSSTKRTYEVHPSNNLTSFQTLIAEDPNVDEQSLTFSNRPVHRAYNIRIAQPSYRSSKAPSISSSDSASATSAPAASSAATPLVPRAKPQQPWDRLVGEFKPAGSSSTTPLAALVLVPAIRDLPGAGDDIESRPPSSSHEPQKEKKQKRKSSSSADASGSPKKSKKRDRASTDGENDQGDDDAASSTPAENSPKKSKKDKSPEKSEKKKKKKT
ncbi:hypothetical protein OC846_003628 [Tilletia horrida]|uniref:Uncharacterized protein n=1 Tax=Tilletia horrida TaxID=155126 RepID=A0AAN6GRV0_9BASI|nr:hypothetical protein OC846_003628 [Tilletia horrida]